MDDTISARVKRVMVEVLSVDGPRLEPDVALEDLDVDELDLIELVMAIEEEFDISITEEELETLGVSGVRLESKYMIHDHRGSLNLVGGTVGEFVEFVRQRVPSSPSSTSAN